MTTSGRRVCRVRLKKSWVKQLQTAPNGDKISLSEAVNRVLSDLVKDRDYA